MKPIARWTLRLFALALIVRSDACLAAWPSDPATGLPICLDPSSQVFPGVISDGAGGAIITWTSGSSGIKAQRVSPNGTTLWPANGVAVTGTLTYEYYGAPAVPDGAGGAIVAWVDRRSAHDEVYAQRLNASGAVLWGTNGVPVGTGPEERSTPTIASDGAGGAFITWADRRAGNYDNYAQRLDSSGTALWAPGGIPVWHGAGDQRDPVIVSDGAGGCHLALLSVASLYLILAGHLNGSGDVSGYVVCQTTGFRHKPSITADGAGGAVVTWADQRSGEHDIYAQRLNTSGAPVWTTNGVAVCAASGIQSAARLVADGIGGSVLAWIDQRSASQDVYAQRLNGSGTPQWAANRIPVATGTGHRYPPLLSPDGTGGVIIVWPWQTALTSHDLVAQRLSSLGVFMWPLPSVTVCDAPSAQTFFNHGGDDPNYRAVMPDGNGGAIVVWEDYRNGGHEDIYAHRLRNDGTLGGTVLAAEEPAPRLGLSVTPNPARGSVTFDAGSLDGGTIEVLDLSGRPIRVFPAPGHPVRWDGRSDAGAQAAPGVYWVRFSTRARALTQRFVWLR